MYSFVRRVKSSVRVYLGDELVIAEQFKNAFGRQINLIDPKTFNEKIQVLKLYDRNPLMTQLADKFRAREYVEALGHGDILNGLLQVCERPEDIDFASLPEQFVIKCNHSWDTNIICNDKLAIDQESARFKLANWLDQNHYYKYREWAYKDIKPIIIIEQYLAGELKDYKFFCFSGVPWFVQVDSGRYGQHALDLFDIDWNRLNCEKGNKRGTATPEARPSYFASMEKIARDISSPFNFCRVDFLATDDRFYFGEATFYPGGGVSKFKPEHFDYRFGEHLDLSGLKRPKAVGLKYRFLNVLGRFGVI